MAASLAALCLVACGRIRFDGLTPDDAATSSDADSGDVSDSGADAAGDASLPADAGEPPGAGCVAEIEAGYYHACARKTDGTLWCWGRNTYGQLGDGSLTNRSTPVQIGDLGSDVEGHACGYHHTCARKADGTVWCWGRNDSGQLGDGTLVDHSRPVQVMGLTDVVQISAFRSHNCAIKTDGTVWCWGNGSQGQLGDGSSSDRLVPVQVVGLTGPSGVVTGQTHTCALMADRTLQCWGLNNTGELGDGTTTSSEVPVVATLVGNDAAGVSLGTAYTCVHETGGSLWCWGANDAGNLGDGTTTSRTEPVQVTALGTDVVEVHAGGTTGDVATPHTCARLRDGSAWCWGDNSDGQLGDGTITPSATPVRVGSATTFTQLTIGKEFSCGAQSDGTLVCWGHNGHLELGNGDELSVRSLTPTVVAITCP